MRYAIPPTPKFVLQCACLSLTRNNIRSRANRACPYSIKLTANIAKSVRNLSKPPLSPSRPGAVLYFESPTPAIPLSAQPPLDTSTRKRRKLRTSRRNIGLPNHALISIIAYSVGCPEHSERTRYAICLVPFQDSPLLPNSHRCRCASAAHPAIELEQRARPASRDQYSHIHAPPNGFQRHKRRGGSYLRTAYRRRCGMLGKRQRWSVDPAVG